MKRFLALLLFLLISCATPNASTDIMSNLEEELSKPEQNITQITECYRGWCPLKEDGYDWVFRVDGGSETDSQILGECYYTYMRVNGVELWNGTYYGYNTDFFGGGNVPEKRADSLSGCVAWLENFIYGDWFI
jgi:hypothetical protein